MTCRVLRISRQQLLASCHPWQKLTTVTTLRYSILCSEILDNYINFFHGPLQYLDDICVLGFPIVVFHIDLQTLHKMFIVNAGPGFKKMLWPAAQKFLDAKTIAKIQVKNVCLGFYTF